MSKNDNQLVSECLAMAKTIGLTDKEAVLAAEIQNRMTHAVANLDVPHDRKYRILRQVVASAALFFNETDRVMAADAETGAGR